MEIVSLVRRALTREDKIKLIALLPWVLIGSIGEFAIVGGAALFFRAIGEPARLQGDGWIAALYQASGLERTGFYLALGAGLIAVVVVANSASVWAHRRAYLTGWNQVVSLGERLLASYLHQPYEYFLTRSTPELIHRLNGEVPHVVKKVFVAFIVLVARVAGSSLIIGWLLWSEPMVSLVLMTGLGVLYGSMYMTVREHLRHNGKQISLTGKRRNRVALERITGIKEIKLHNLESDALATYREPSSAYAGLMAWHETLNNVSRLGLESAAIAGVVLASMAILMLDRPLESLLPVMATFAVASFRLLPTFQHVFTTASNAMTQAFALKGIVRDLRGAPPTARAEAVDVPFEAEIALVDATYTYPTGDVPSLQRVDLRLRKGRWTAVVGSTGSGKSTLVDVLTGLLVPQTGHLAIDGRPLTTVAEVRGWQAHIGYVPQSMFVTHDTVARNIAFGGTVDMDRVREAATMAAFDAFVENELPKGYENEVAERGLRLSGGQRQRMALARAFYRRPAFLVLDEATSALDNVTEAEVVHRLRTNFRDTTVLMVAHRLSSTRHCDEILMMEGGRIVARGTYDELYATCTPFRSLVDARDPADAEPAGHEAPVAG